MVAVSVALFIHTVLQRLTRLQANSASRGPSAVAELLVRTVYNSVSRWITGSKT